LGARPDRVEGSVYIGHVGTRRPWRKRGLASALLSASVRAAAAAGKTQASLGVDADSPTGAVGVYERLGFKVRHKVVVYHWTVREMTEQLTIRPYVESDAEAIADLINTIEAKHGAEAGWTGGELRSLIKAWVRDPATDSRLVVTPDGELVAVGIVSPPPDGGQRADMLGGVHPAHQGRGLGREMLAWQYERVRHLHTDVAPDAPWHVETGSSVNDRAAIRLFERFGFGPVRYFFEMIAQLDGKRTDQAMPDGLALAPYAPELGKPLYEAHMEAFSDHWGFQSRAFEKWVLGTVESEEFRPDLSRIAFDGDEIAAYVLAYDNVEGREYIGQVGTRRPWRKRGVASALISASLAAAVADGKSSASLGVDADSPSGAVGVYERLGFEVKHKFVSYRRPVE
jgi:mycothiol synthase